MPLKSANWDGHNKKTSAARRLFSLYNIDSSAAEVFL